MKIIKSITSSKMFPSLLVLALILLFNLIVQPGFLSIEIRDGQLFGGLITILNRSVPVMILAIGMTLVISTGGVDLSVGSVVAVSAAVALSLIRGDDVAPTAYTSMPIVLVVIISLSVGLLLGVWNGILIAKTGMPPVVATLVLMVAGRGLTQVITGERFVTVGYEPFRSISGGNFLGMPNQPWIVLGIFLLVWLFTRRTALGLFIETVGANKSAATYAGVRSNIIIILVYGISGICASIVGILAASSVLVVDPTNTGLNMELSAIVAVVLGGTSMKGGKFNLGGSCVGAIILMALTQTMFFYGVPVEFSLAIQAIVIVIVVVIQSPIARNFVTSLFKFKKREVASS